MDPQQQIADLTRRMEYLENQAAQPVNLDTMLAGMIDVVTTAPSTAPRTLYDQVKIYTSGTTYRLYWYDWRNQAWHYATGT